MTRLARAGELALKVVKFIGGGIVFLFGLSIAAYDEGIPMLTLAIVLGATAAYFGFMLIGAALAAPVVELYCRWERKRNPPPPAPKPLTPTDPGYYADLDITLDDSNNWIVYNRHFRSRGFPTLAEAEAAMRALPAPEPLGLNDPALYVDARVVERADGWSIEGEQIEIDGFETYAEAHAALLELPQPGLFEELRARAEGP